MNESNAKKIILAVDDMPMNLATIQVILHDGFDIRLSKSAKVALTMLNTIKADLILLDIEMPEMSGFEFLERLQNNPELKQIPVVFITSHESPEFTIKAAASGAKDYVIKPIVPGILLKKINAILEAPVLPALL
ncbi:MAG: response regulator [Treponema sp.]|jgi:putative two-component system response regulator|nr:response regulator [Treponema sp.]